MLKEFLETRLVRRVHVRCECKCGVEVESEQKMQTRSKRERAHVEDTMNMKKKGHVRRHRQIRCPHAQMRPHARCQATHPSRRARVLHVGRASTQRAEAGADLRVAQCTKSQRTDMFKTNLRWGWLLGAGGWSLASASTSARREQCTGEKSEGGGGGLRRKEDTEDEEGVCCTRRSKRAVCAPCAHADAMPSCAK